jgi:hypothetical protein
MKIYDINGKELSNFWKAEFRGLFAGEGCLFLGTATRKTKTGSRLIYRPEAIITLRSDDLPLLKEVQSRLGGRLSQRSDIYLKGRELPRHRWYVQSKEDLLRVSLILQESLLPAKKWRELPYWTEAVLLRKNRGEKHTPDENQRLAFLLQAIRDVRVFKVR